jgi:hypothetical protein
MRWIREPEPIDQSTPEAQAAIARIMVELATVRREQPGLIEHAALREARRHAGDRRRRRPACSDDVAAAADHQRSVSWRNTVIAAATKRARIAAKTVGASVPPV